MVMNENLKTFAVATARYVQTLAQQNNQNYRLRLAHGVVEFGPATNDPPRQSEVIIRPNDGDLEIGLALGSVLLQPAILSLNDNEKKLAASNDKIGAIKAVRERSDGINGKMGLREAKDLVDAFMATREFEILHNKLAQEHLNNPTGAFPHVGGFPLDPRRY